MKNRLYFLMAITGLIWMAMTAWHFGQPEVIRVHAYPVAAMTPWILPGAIIAIIGLGMFRKSQPEK